MFVLDKLLLPWITTHRNLIQGHYTSVAHKHSMGEVWGRQGQMKKKNAPDWDLHTDLLQSWS